MSYIQYKLESPSGTSRRTGYANGTLACYYGSTNVVNITSATTISKSTGNKMMSGDLKFGSTTLSCANKMFPADIVLRTSVTSGANYHIITGSGTWTVPVNVTSINVFVVGGGAGGGTRYMDYSTSGRQHTWGGAGGSGGYVNRGTYSVTPNSTFTCVIGSGGAGADPPSATTTHVIPSAGSETSFTGTSSSGTAISLKAAGGTVYKTYYSGNGGTAGGYGGQRTFVRDSGSTYINAEAGRTNGASSSVGGTPYSSGQVDVTGPNGETGNTTCSVDGVAYSGGGGGGGFQGIGQSSSGISGGNAQYGGSYGGGQGGAQYTVSNYTVPTAGTANSGGGGGGGGYRTQGTDYGAEYGKAGGSGIIIISW